MYPYITPSLLVICLLVALYSFHKIRSIHLIALESTQITDRQSLELHRQTEALQGLYVDLKLEKSLPPTRGWAASPDFLLEVAQYALYEKPLTVVECSSGTSTLVLARCMQLNGSGKVYSLEHDPEYAKKTRLQLERHGLSSWAVVLDAPLRQHSIGGETWQWYAEERLAGHVHIDMVVIDGPPSRTQPLARYPAGPILFPLLANKAAVFLDDSNRADEQAILSRWQIEFPLLEQSVRHCEKGCAVLQKTGAPAG